MRKPLLIVALFLASVAASPAVASATANRCANTGATVVRNADARVYRVPGRYGQVIYFACSLKRGRAYRLGRRANFSGDRDGLWVPTLSGPLVAYMTTDGGKTGFTSDVVVRSLRSGRVINKVHGCDFADCTMVQPRAASDLVLTANGSIAVIWTAEQPDRSTILHVSRKNRGRPFEDLAESPAIESHSLGLSAEGRFYWTADGEPHSAWLT
jgi:hypothetical protein